MGGFRPREDAPGRSIKLCQLNACLLNLSLLLSMALFPYMTNAQSSGGLPVSYKFGGERNNFHSNVALNEINIHAFPHFRKRWPAVTGETSVNGVDGGIVSFKEHSLYCQARVDVTVGCAE